MSLLWKILFIYLNVTYSVFLSKNFARKILVLSLLSDLLIYPFFSSMEEIDLAYKDALTGVPSRRPLIEMTIPSALDRTISPPGMPSLCLLLYCGLFYQSYHKIKLM